MTDRPTIKPKQTERSSNRYLEFKNVDGSYVFKGGKIYKVRRVQPRRSWASDKTHSMHVTWYNNPKSHQTLAP